VRLRSRYPAQSQAIRIAPIPPNTTKSCQRKEDCLAGPNGLGLLDTETLDPYL
jgi:hypothetical protein